MGEGQSVFRFYSPSMLGHQPVEMKKGELLIKLKLTRGLKYRQGTYNVVKYFIFGIDHVVVHVSRYPEQMLLPFFPPIFV